ncbi:MAG: 1,4-dihydroxy-2-naphthoate polyprenyltransferase [Jatrophihabitans sp.]
MAAARDWVAGARPRTLPAAVVPVVVGSGVAFGYGHFSLWRGVLALIVALALQVGVNYANDYSDGIRGTDVERVGPLRLVGAGVASPRTVLGAALGSFVVAGIAGLALAAWTTWWLVLVGVGAIVAAWNYTGGARPYGYRALGELAVFAFFGLVAVGGTAYVQTERVTRTAVLTAVPVGLLACALLVANNLRDIPGDTVAGKRTLAVVLGASPTRTLYAVLLALPFGIAVVLAVTDGGWPLLALAAAPLALSAARPVLRGAAGPALIPTLKATGVLTLVFAALLAAGLFLA